MPLQPHRTRSLRRVKVKTPGGRVKIHYRKRKPKKAHCAVCKNVLLGVPNQRPYKMRTMPKTSKRPERIYGGVLCSKCAKNKIISDLNLKKQYKLSVGRLCVKLLGREAGKKCVVVDIKDKKALIDGQVKRRVCNINHLITLPEEIKIKKNATSEEIKKEFEKLKILIKPKKSKTKKERPKKQRKKKKKVEKTKKTSKK